jgi:hypothetical protein
LVSKRADHVGRCFSGAWGISDILTKSGGKAIMSKSGWILTLSGRESLKEKEYLVEKNSILVNDVEDLRGRLSSVYDQHTKDFLEEAISCLENNQKRAAVVLSWIGAVSVLYNYAVANRLSDFNAESSRRDAKWKAAKNIDDLSHMKEHSFLEVLESISIIGRNAKSELQDCLRLRNSCGHPNSLKIGIRRVSSHLEMLMMNVFSKF